MKHVYAAVRFTVGFAALALVAGMVAPTAAHGEAPAAAVAEARLLAQLVTPSLESGIVCTFWCEDGTGLVLNPCTDGSLSACCARGEPACADHGGLQDGICQQGRLGLPCVPF